jgi:2-dehydro-3-deoxygluconokinase
VTARVWTLGEALAVLVPDDVLPAEQADRLRVGVGGAELNVAIGLARLGHHATFVGVAGDDPWGRKIIRELRAEGVEARVRIDPGAFTGAYLRERRAAGLTRATYLRSHSAGSHITEAELDALEMTNGDILHLTGITPALSESALSCWVAAAEKTQSLGCRVSLDVNFRGALWTPEQARTVIDKVLPLTSTVLIGHDELEVLFQPGADTVDAGAVFARSLPAGCDLIVKNGARGSYHYNSQRRITTGSALPADVVDVVGAGDSFAAGYLSGVLDGLPVAARLERGHQCAAFVVATHGDWEGAPRRAELGTASALRGTEVTR